MRIGDAVFQLIIDVFVLAMAWTEFGAWAAWTILAAFILCGVLNFISRKW